MGKGIKITDNDQKKVMSYFLSNQDNRTKVVADKTGVKYAKVDKIISKHYRLLMDENK